MKPKFPVPVWPFCQVKVGNEWFSCMIESVKSTREIVVIYCPRLPDCSNFYDPSGRSNKRITVSIGMLKGHSGNTITVAGQVLPTDKKKK